MTDTTTVLIVDDDLTNRLILRALLKDSGFESLEAVDGQQAIDIIEANDIDIVLLDVMMPVMNGYQAARIIKSRHEGFIPIIFLTAMSDEKALAECIEAGGDDFLVKPYNHTILRAKIDSMLRIRKLYSKIDEQNRELNKHSARVKQEINVAKKVFGNLLDHDMRDGSTGLRYIMSPMSIFNGDLILAERNQTDGLDVLVSDFTGHGLSAAIGSIPVFDIFYTMTKKGFSCTEILTEANNKLVKLLPTQMFMAAALVSIDRTNNVVTVINCGLPDLYLWRKGKIIKVFKSTNIPVGISRLVSESFTLEMSALEYGDRIFVSTDGIMEATNRAGEMYGKQGILDSIASVDQPENIFNKILDDCLVFTEDTEQRDDITLLELCHQESVHYEEDVQSRPEIRPAQWSMQFNLDIHSLRHFDILPFIMQGVNGLQSIPNSGSTIHTILTEIFANALDHGILGLDSSMKNSPDGYMEFYREKTRRLETFSKGSIQLSLAHELKPDGGGRLVVHAIDSGNGFDYKNVDYSLEDNTSYSGRGIGLISQLCKEVRFLGKGNAIMAIYEWE